MSCKQNTFWETSAIIAVGYLPARVFVGDFCISPCCVSSSRNAIPNVRERRANSKATASQIGTSNVDNGKTLA
eukprot:5113386-Amphidinium_carterae.1